jgi:hypothetical protein
MGQPRYELISNGGLYAVWDRVAGAKVSFWFSTLEEAKAARTVLRDKPRSNKSEAARIADWVESLIPHHGAPARAALHHVVEGIRRDEY